jgi:hypothetical protein
VQAALLDSYLPSLALKVPTKGDDYEYVLISSISHTGSKNWFGAVDSSIPCISGGALRRWVDRLASLSDEKARNRLQQRISRMTTENEVLSIKH